MSASSAPCYPGAIFPKLVGYGKKDTDIISVDRRSDGVLAMAAITQEADIVGSAAVPAETGTWMSYDPSANSYIWVKIVENVKQQNIKTFARFNGSGDKVLAVYQNQSNNYMSLIYFNAADGTMLTTHAFSKTLCCGYTEKDGIVINNDGSKIFYVMNRKTPQAAVIGAIGFDSTNALTPWSNNGHTTYDAQKNDNILQKYSMVLSTDESRLISFITGNDENMDCRYDVWDTSLPMPGPPSGSSLYNKGSKAIKDRNCRFPHFMTNANSNFYILVLTEYYKLDKTGFLRVELESDYTEKSNQDEEHVFTGYTFRFTSAYYVGETLMYGVAVDQADSNKNYLVRYDWDDPNKAPELYPLKGLSENPNAAVYAGLPHLDSVIYATNSDAKDFKVKAWIVGGSKSVWAYDDCLAPDFGITVESYKQLVATPGTSKLGYLSKLELDVLSCNHEHYNEINILIPGADGEGIQDDDEDIEHYGYTSGDDLFAQVTPTVKDLTAASDSGISPGAWESSFLIDLTTCAATSADETYYDFVAAIFDGNDIFEYELGAGPKNVDFTASDWFVSGNTCTVDYTYMVKIGPAGTITATTPTTASKIITIDSSDLSLSAVDQKVTVLARTPSYQCLQKDFTIKPYNCALTVISGAFWTNSVNPLRQVDYTIIESGSVLEPFKWVSSFQTCPFTHKIEKETSVGVGDWSAYTGPVISYSLTSNPAPGQHLYGATINTSDVSIDSSGLTPPVWSFMITVGSPTLAGKQKEFKIEISFKNRCRDAVVDLTKILMPMENIIGEIAVTQTVSDYTFTAASPAGLTPADCGTQSIHIFEDGFVGGLTYSSFITSSGMVISLQSNNDAHIGVYYLKVEVSWSSFPVKYRNDVDFQVKLKPGCKDDTFSSSKWIAQASATISVYDHTIGFDTDKHIYSPIVNQFSYCTAAMIYTLQEETSPGVWGSVSPSPPQVTHTQASNELKILATASDYALDQQTKNYRIGVSSVPLLVNAVYPTILQVTVKFVHPCWKTTFSNNTPQPALTSLPVSDSTKLSVTDFAYALQSRAPPIDCLTQTISVSATSAVAPGTLADFITISKPASTWELNVAPVNSAQIGSTYTLQLTVTLVNYPSVTYTSPNTFQVQILQGCSTGTMTSLTWNDNGTSNIPKVIVNLTNIATNKLFTVVNSPNYCLLDYTLAYYPSGVAYSDPHITVNTVSGQVELKSSLGTLHGTTDSMQLVVSFNANAASKRTITFSVQWNDICTSDSVKTLKWLSGALVLGISDAGSKQVILNYVSPTYLLLYEVQVNDPLCSLTTVLEVQDSVTSVWSTYSDPHVTNAIFLGNQHQIKAQSTNMAFDRQTQSYRVKAYSGTNSGMAQYLTFQILWLDRCWTFSPTVVTNAYPNSSIEVFGPMLYFSAPTITTTIPIFGENCGSYNFKVIWGLPDRIQRIDIETDKTNGSFSWMSTDPLDAGQYNVQVKIIFDAYPTVFVSQYFTLTVQSCLPPQIIPPLESTKIIYVIGSDQPLTTVMGKFIQVPACDAELEYKLVDENEVELETGMAIKTVVATTGIVIVSVDTKDEKRVGNYKIKLYASTKLGSTRSIPILIEVELTKVPEYTQINTPPYFDGIQPVCLHESDYPYTLPAVIDLDFDDVTTEVFLGDASSFLRYDPFTREITLDRAALESVSQIDRYSIRIELKDGSRFTAYNLKLCFEEPEEELEKIQVVSEYLPLAVAYLEPEIEEISIFGQVTIVWNQDIRRMENDTYFEEQLKRWIWLVDVNSKETIFVPALQVEFINSDVRETPDLVNITNWNFEGWDDDRTMKLSLEFDQTEVVSMEIPADYLNITFWDQRLFLAYNPDKAVKPAARYLQEVDSETENEIENGDSRVIVEGMLYVQKQYELTERIPPQVPANGLTDALKAVALILSGGIGFIFTGSAFLSIFFNKALGAIWMILHAMQLSIHLPLFVDTVPGYAKLVFAMFIDIARMDLVDSEDTIANLFDLNADEEPFNMRFGWLQYESKNFLMNTGNIMVFIGSTLLLMAIAASLKLCKDSHKCVNKVRKKMIESLYYNPFVRLITEMSLEFFLVAMVDLSVKNLTSSGYRLSYAISIIALVSLLGYLLVLTLFIGPRYIKLKDQTYQKSWGSFYFDYNLRSKRLALVQTFWFIARRCLYAACAVFAADSLWLSLQVLFNSSIVAIFIIGWIKPYDALNRNRLEMFNEVIQALLQYHLICFTDMVRPAETRTIMGISCAITLCLNLFILVWIALGQVCFFLKQLLRRRIAWQGYRSRLRIRNAHYDGKIPAYQGGDPTVEDLKQKVIDVELKAKEMSYLKRFKVSDSNNLKINPMAKIPMPKIPMPKIPMPKIPMPKLQDPKPINASISGITRVAQQNFEKKQLDPPIVSAANSNFSLSEAIETFGDQAGLNEEPNLVQRGYSRAILTTQPTGQNRVNQIDLDDYDLDVYQQNLPKIKKHQRRREPKLEEQANLESPFGTMPHKKNVLGHKLDDITKQKQKRTGVTWQPNSFALL